MTSEYYSRSSRYGGNERSCRKSTSRDERGKRRGRVREEESLRSRKRSHEPSPLSAPKRRRSRSTEGSRRKEVPRKDDGSRRKEESRREEGSRREDGSRREEGSRRDDGSRREEGSRREDGSSREEGSRRDRPSDSQRRRAEHQQEVPRYDLRKNDDRYEERGYRREERSLRRGERTRKGSVDQDKYAWNNRECHGGGEARRHRRSRSANYVRETRDHEDYQAERRSRNEERMREDEYYRRNDRGDERVKGLKRSRSRSYRGNAKRSKRESRPVVEDDEEGHLIFTKGDIIQGRYKIMGELGEGTFGKVVKCEDLTKKKTLAIKIIKNVKKYRDAAKLEINVLKKLSNYDPDCIYKCVQMYDWFDYHGHKCIAFELLGKSVFDFLKDNNYEPYPIEHVRSIAYELCLSVNFIHTNRLTHTDLKPENVLFYDSSKTKKDKKTKKEILLNPEIRLIDFGSATFEHEHHSSIIQTRHYRAPEVILKLGWDHSCDIWSVGCIVFELALGIMLFDTHSSEEHLAMMTRILGNIPHQMALKSGSSYFNSKGVLNWDPESKEGKHVRRKVKPLERYIPREERENRDWLEMFDLIRRMLDYNPATRISLPQAMEHPFLERMNLRKPSRSSSGYASR